MDNYLTQQKSLTTDTSLKNVMSHIVTPFSPYFFCDHYIGTEAHHFNIPIPDSIHNILLTRDLSTICEGDFILCEVNYFHLFCAEILPKIQNKIVLVTSQYNLPQIHRTQTTDDLLKNDKIIRWISQNPIYSNEPKYVPFPYGICHNNVVEYMQHFVWEGSTKKIHNLTNMHSSIHPHLPKTHIRLQYDILGKDSGPMLPYKEFCENLQKTEFVISTVGDRDDCYRHYEAIGLGAIPISNVNSHYKALFGNNMHYSGSVEINEVATRNAVSVEYHEPNKELIFISYYVKRSKNIMA